MAKKEIKAKIKLQCPGGQATPAPPVGPALGQHGVNIGEFIRRFNEATKEAGGLVIPVDITVYSDRSFDFVTKSPPAAVLLKRAAQVAKGAGNPKAQKIGTVTKQQLLDIAKVKFSDMNASSLEHAASVIAGTARSMGLDVVE